MQRIHIHTHWPPAEIRNRKRKEYVAITGFLPQWGDPPHSNLLACSALDFKTWCYGYLVFSIIVLFGLTSSENVKPKQ